MINIGDIIAKRYNVTVKELPKAKNGLNNALLVNAKDSTTLCSKFVFTKHSVCFVTI